jgi:hypothetical protein
MTKTFQDLHHSLPSPLGDTKQVSPSRLMKYRLVQPPLMDQNPQRSQAPHTYPNHQQYDHSKYQPTTTPRTPPKAIELTTWQLHFHRHRRANDNYRNDPPTTSHPTSSSPRSSSRRRRNSNGTTRRPRSSPKQRIASFSKHTKFPKPAYHSKATKTTKPTYHPKTVRCQQPHIKPTAIAYIRTTPLPEQLVSPPRSNKLHPN